MSEDERWRRISDLLAEATALDPEGREAFFVELGRRDPEAAGEVRSLLAAHDAAGGFLESQPPVPSLEDWSDLDLPADSQLGPYRVLEELGRGGMGAVFRAVRDDRQFRREVAIKLIPKGLDTTLFLRRFQSERQILAALDHPNIARLLDAGAAPDGRPYLIMEYVPGVSILRHCDDHRLDVPRRVDLFLALCDAVQFAHRNLVVHRDLKPGNVIVTPEGVPKLLDFGIAKLLDPKEAEATVTAVGSFLTPEYASPEQIRGEPVTTASDVYSLGVILYELLTGRPPYRLEGRSPTEVLRVLSERDPAEPSAVVTRPATAGTDPETLAQLRGESALRLHRRLRGDLDRIVLMALEKEPERRYGSVEQLADDLRRWREGRPVRARAGGRVYRLSRFLRRNPLAVGAGAVALISLVAGTGIATWQAAVAGRERDRAEQRFHDVRELARAVMFDIHDAIENLPGSTLARELVVDHAVRYLDRLERESVGDPQLERELATAYRKIGDVQGRPFYGNLGRTEDCLQSYTRSLALFRAAATALPESLSVGREVVVAHHRMVEILRKMGRHDEAMTHALAARERLGSLVAKAPNDLLLQREVNISCDKMADLHLAAADTQGALVERRRALEVVEELAARDPGSRRFRRGIVVDCLKTADLLGAGGGTAEAERLYRRAAAAAQDLVAMDASNHEARRDLSVVYSKHGVFLSWTGAIDSALAVYARGHAIAEAMAAEDPEDVSMRIDVAAGHYEMADILETGGRLGEAVEQFSLAYEGYRRLAEADTSDAESRVSMADAARRLGALHRRLGEEFGGADRVRHREEGRRWLARSLEVYRQLAASGRLSEAEMQSEVEAREELVKLDSP